jgi:hypothetical protein
MGRMNHLIILLDSSMLRFHESPYTIEAVGRELSVVTLLQFLSLFHL